MAGFAIGTLSLESSPLLSRGTSCSPNTSMTKFKLLLVQDADGFVQS